MAANEYVHEYNLLECQVSVSINIPINVQVVMYEIWQNILLLEC